MQKTGKKFLERWANMYSLARTIPRDRRFNMDHWGRRDSKSECGTAACLAGHAVLHPWFRRRRFTALEHEMIPTEGFGINWDALTDFWGSYWGSNPFAPQTCAMLCGKNEAETENITPKQAAKAVKKWMLMYWPKEEVEAAIEKAEATYDPKWVHKYTPWDCPTSDE